GIYGAAVGGVAGAISSNQNSFDSKDNAAFLQAQTEQIQGEFNAVGAAFEQLLGVADDIGGQIGAILANNIGGNLENLQILVQTTGKSFEDLGNAIFDSFFNGNLSITELYANLIAVQDLTTVGIPGAVGAVDQAFQNFQISLQNG